MNVSLIANTGIQFFTHEIELNPEEQTVLPNGNIMFPMSFYESCDYINDQLRLEFAYYFPKHKCYVPYSDLKAAGYILTSEYGDEIINELGQPQPCNEEDINFDFLTTLLPTNCYSEYCLSGTMGADGQSPFEKMNDHWVPMPFFEYDNVGNSVFGPYGWCRLKITQIGVKPNGMRRFRLVWAFDTRSESMLTDKNPYFYEGENMKKYGLCNRCLLLFDFFSHEWVSDYLANLLTEPYTGQQQDIHFRYLSFYIYMVNSLRLSNLYPEVTLYNDAKNGINVDLVLDIGNSRTCGVLFENSDFTKACMLQLRDLTDPHKVYSDPFDMRLAFHKADFGMMDVEDVFEWKSFLRVGEEATKLIYRARQDDGISEKTTNYSSPKRYLWDNKEYNGQWEFIVTVDEEKDTAMEQSNLIYVKGLSEQFNSDGTLLTEGNGGVFSSFSRRSLMTFVMIEIIQQAKCQINSYGFRYKHGNIDVPRRLKHIIVTCPTAMPIEEQVTLRKCAEEAYVALLRCGDPQLYYKPYRKEEWEEAISIVPSVDDLENRNMNMFAAKKEWGYDEASCCQLVYLYAEIAERYRGDCEKFIKQKGHVREDFKEEGYDQESITIGSVDIGAGTTDLMICSYRYSYKGAAKLTPIPLFWDSFYFAGDDVLMEIVRELIIEGNGKEFLRSKYGPIYNAICANMAETKGIDLSNLSDDKTKWSNATLVVMKQIRKEASIIIHGFFGKDTATMDFVDRTMRHDFNIQISIPIALKMMEMLRINHPACDLVYSDIFKKEMEPASYLISYCERKFGFNIKEIKWSFSPEHLSDIIRARLEPLMKQLSVILNSYHCDIVLLAGKPMSLTVVTDLFLKFFPVTPDRLIRLNSYRVGNWYPFADSRGYFVDQKPVVAVGAMIGYKASNGGLNDFHLDMSKMKQNMISTAKYIGYYDALGQRIQDPFLTPQKNAATFLITGFPTFIGCKQLKSVYYQARPLYAVTCEQAEDEEDIGDMELKITITRLYSQDRENLSVVSIVNGQGMPVSQNKVKIAICSLAEKGAYWLDKGAFTLAVRDFETVKQDNNRER